jgi:urea transport system permease protein
VYIALITQALTLAFATLLISQQGTTGGFNGLTNFNTFMGISLNAPGTRTGLYAVTALVLVGMYLMSRWLAASHAGKLLLAIRDGENRVRFLGYDPALYKTFVFAVGALLAGVAGALYTLHLGVISPAMVGVLPSIEMVIGVAIGGREVLGGAIVGTVFLNIAKDRISSAFPDAWLYVIGALFILVVIVLPRGLAGILQSMMEKLSAARTAKFPAPAPEAPLAGDLRVTAERSDR